MNQNIMRAALAVTASLSLALGSAQAATIVKTPGTPSVIPGLTGFQTTGAMMTGLSIRAVFDGGADQTLAWATTGANSGGVFGLGWSLTLAGDSFATNAWDFQIAPTAGLGALTMLVIDGSNALTVLDTSNPSSGSPGSASGRNFSLQNAALDALATATYSNEVSISPNGAVGDLYQLVTVTFSQGGPRESFRFSQDTDNDSRLNRVPEPGALALAGLALLAVGASRRQRRA